MPNLRKLEAVAKLCYASIFDGDRDVVLPNGHIVPVWLRTDTGVRFVIVNRDHPVEWEFIEQNIRTGSRPAKLAERGHRIMWVWRNGDYYKPDGYHTCGIVDGEWYLNVHARFNVLLSYERAIRA